MSFINDEDIIATTSCYYINLLDGLFLRDLYPGYGKLTQSYDKAKKEFDDFNLDLHDEIIEIKEDFSQKIDVFYSETQNKLKHYATYLNRKRELKERFDADNYQIETACKALLESYNVPQPWDDYLPSHVHHLDWHLDKDTREYENQLVAFNEFRNKKNKVLSDIQSSFQKNYNQLTAVNDAVQIQQ